MQTTKTKTNDASITFLQRLQTCSLLPPEQLKEICTLVGESESQLSDYLIKEGMLTSFQLKQLRSGSTGFHVDKYIVLDCIGRGGNGIVFKARHSQIPNRLVALKTIDTRNVHQGDEALIRFRREMELVISLHHPNIVRAYETIRTRAQQYLVMELVDGEDLGTLVRRRGPLPVEEAVGYIVQAARGLAYAHRCGIVHRDLKPANLLLTKDGVLKLADLGLARNDNANNETELTLKGMCLGTPEFMAPEQAEDATRANGRSDLFSLGATLFHLLTGELHVVGASFMQRLQRLLTNPPRALASVRPELHPQLCDIVDRLRSQNPEERPATAEETLALLEPFANGLVPPSPPWTAQRKFDLILEVLQGKILPQDACKRNCINIQEFENWKKRFLDGARESLEDPQVGLNTPQDNLQSLRTRSITSLPKSSGGKSFALSSPSGSRTITPTSSSGKKAVAVQRESGSKTLAPGSQ